MSVGAKKYIAWVLLLVGAAVDYFFFAICLMKGLPPSFVYALWPLCATAVTAWAVFYLRMLYYKDPPTPPGAWRLTLVDLMAVSFFCALSFSILKGFVQDDDFQVLGPLFAPLSALLFLGGLLGASLNGIFRWQPRFVFAFLHAGRSFGWMVVGMFVILLAAVILQTNRFSEAADIFTDVLGMSARETAPPILWLIRWGIVALALSSYVLAKTREALRKEG